MKKSTKIRIFGAIVLLFNVVLVGFLDLTGPVVLVITFGLAAVIELFFVRPAVRSENISKGK